MVAPYRRERGLKCLLFGRGSYPVIVAPYRRERGLKYTSPTLSSRSPGRRSLSQRAWIEIFPSPYFCVKWSGRSLSQGAWIEMFLGAPGVTL